MPNLSEMKDPLASGIVFWPSFVSLKGDPGPDDDTELTLSTIPLSHEMFPGDIGTAHAVVWGGKYGTQGIFSVLVELLHFDEIDDDGNPVDTPTVYASKTYTTEDEETHLWFLWFPVVPTELKNYFILRTTPTFAGREEAVAATATLGTGDSVLTVTAKDAGSNGNKYVVELRAQDGVSPLAVTQRNNDIIVGLERAVDAAAVAATKVLGSDTSVVTITAKTAGAAGNSIGVYTVKAEQGGPGSLSAGVYGKAIVIHLQTDEVGAIVTTGASLANFLNADNNTKALIVASDGGAGVMADTVGMSLSGGSDTTYEDVSTGADVEDAINDATGIDVVASDGGTGVMVPSTEALDGGEDSKSDIAVFTSMLVLNNSNNLDESVPDLYKYFIGLE